MVTKTKERGAVKRKAGRPRTGEYRQCPGCGREIYVRRHRLKEGKEYYCRKCFIDLSPSRKGEPRAQAEIPAAICDKCGEELIEIDFGEKVKPMLVCDNSKCEAYHQPRGKDR